MNYGYPEWRAERVREELSVEDGVQLAELNEWIEDRLKEIPGSLRHTARIRAIGDGEFSSREIYMEYSRPETKEEAADRAKRDDEYAAKREREEREQLAELSKKYGAQK